MQTMKELLHELAVLFGLRDVPALLQLCLRERLYPQDNGTTLSPTRGAYMLWLEEYQGGAVGRWRSSHWTVLQPFWTGPQCWVCWEDWHHSTELGAALSTECSSVADARRDGDRWALPPGYVGSGMEDIGWGGYPSDSTAGTGSSYESPCGNGEWREDWTDQSWMPNWADVQRATEPQVNPRWRACVHPEPTQGKWSLCICCLGQRSSVHWEYSMWLFVCQAICGDMRLLAVTVPVRGIWLTVQVNGGVLPPQTNSTTITWLCGFWKMVISDIGIEKLQIGNTGRCYQSFFGLRNKCPTNWPVPFWGFLIHPFSSILSTLTVKFWHHVS